MSEITKPKTPIFHTELIVPGDESSRISSLIFFLLCMIPVFSTVIFGAVDNVTWVFILIFWALIIVLWLAEAWRTDGMLINSSSLQLPLIGFLLIGIIQLLPLGSASGGEVLGIPVSQALSVDPYSTRFFLIKLVVYAVFFSACLAFINQERRFKKVVLMIVIFGAFMAFFGILQRLANPDGIYGIRSTPHAIPFGPFVNQHHFASFMQMTGGVALGLLFGKTTRKDKKILLAIAVVIMGIAIVLTSSRGGLLGFGAVLAFVTVLNFLSGRWSGDSLSESRDVGMPRKVALAAAGVAIVVVIFGSVLLLGGNDSLLRGIGAVKADGDFSSGRAHFWPIAIQIFFEHPFFGAGFEAFGTAFTKHDTWRGQFRVEQAHNEYLQTLADAGLAGFACVVGFIYLLFRKGLKTIVDSTGLRRDAAVGALAGCFGILVHSFFDFPMRTPSNAFFFLLLCAVATVSIRSKDAHAHRRSHRASAL